MEGILVPEIADLLKINENPSKIEDLDKVDWMHESLTTPPVSRYHDCP